MRLSPALAMVVAASPLLASCLAGPMPPSAPHPLAGSAAPEFHETTTSDREVGVPGGMRTRVTVVDFWASWCSGCQQTLPAMDALYRDRHEDGVMVIGVDVDEASEEGLALARKLRATFPIVLDPGMRLAGRYGVGSVPLTFVVDRRGTVRWVGRDPGAARRAVEFVLAEQ
jgi:peroxiredoxin